jgi:hypothetical protein
VVEIGQPHASGRWLVNAGSEDEFTSGGRLSHNGRWITLAEQSPSCYFGTRPTPGGFSLLGLLRARRQ